MGLRLTSVGQGSNRIWVWDYDPPVEPSHEPPVVEPDKPDDWRATEDTSHGPRGPA